MQIEPKGRCTLWFSSNLKKRGVMQVVVLSYIFIEIDLSNYVLQRVCALVILFLLHFLIIFHNHSFLHRN